MNFQWNIRETEAYAGGIELGKRLAAVEGKGPEGFRARWRLATDAGLLNWSGWDPLQLAAGLEGLGEGCPDNGFLLSVHAHWWGGLEVVRRWGSPSLRNSVLAGLASGVTLAAHAVTEPGSGGDVLHMESTGERDAGGYRLRGHKTFVTNGPLCDGVVVYVRTGDPGRPDALTAFYLPASHPGWTRGPRLKTLGMEGAFLGEIFLENCRVENDHRLGGEGSGLALLSESMQWERTFVVGTLLGAMGRLIRECTDFANTVRGRGRLGDLPQIQDPIFRMETQREVTRLLFWRAAAALRDRKTALVESAMAKVWGSESLVEMCHQAMKILGARGYLEQASAARELRDALAGPLYSGSNGVLKNLVGSQILARAREFTGPNSPSTSYPSPHGRPETGPPVSPPLS